MRRTRSGDSIRYAFPPREGLPSATTTRGTGPTMADPAGCRSAPDIWIAP